MPIVTIEHEEYPSVIVIEYNSLYKNELVNFIHNIKIKDNKEEVYTEPYFFKIIQINMLFPKSMRREKINFLEFFIK